MTVIAAGLASAAVYVYVALALPIGNSWSLVGRFLVAFALVAVICWWVWLRLDREERDRAPAERTRALRWVLAYAILFRILLLPAGFAGPDPATALARDLSGERTGFGKFLLYDNDVWRYLWDGHTAASGYSPYAFPPSVVDDDEKLTEGLLAEDLWWDVHDNLGFRALVTVYPPFAQLFFRVAHLVAPGSVLVLKLGAVAADLGVCWLLLVALGRLGLPRAGVVLYAWNPLVLKEVAGSGHFEPLMLLPTLAAVAWAAGGRGGLAAGSLAAATLVKLSPLALLPVLARRLRWRHALIGAGVLALGLAPHWRTLGGWLDTLRVYGGQWHFNSGPWALVRAGLDALGVGDSAAVASMVCRAGVVGVMIWVWRRDDCSPRAAYRGAYVILAALVVLSPAVMPWYVMWALPFAILAGSPAWALFGMLSLLSYSFYAAEVEHVWWRVVEYGGLAAALVWERRRPAPGVTPPAVPRRAEPL